MPDLPVVITKHPIGGLKPDQVREKASAMLEATIEAVVEATEKALTPDPSPVLTHGRGG